MFQVVDADVITIILFSFDSPLQGTQLGFSWALTYSCSASSTPYPNITVVNVNMSDPSMSVTYDPGSVLGGTYTLSLSGAVSQPIAIGASNAAISAAISTLVPNSSVTVFQSGLTLTTFTMSVVWNYPSLDYPPLVVGKSNLTGKAITV